MSEHTNRKSIAAYTIIQPSTSILTLTPQIPTPKISESGIAVVTANPDSAVSQQQLDLLLSLAWWNKHPPPSRNGP